MKPLSKRIAALPVSAALAVDLKAKALEQAGRDIVSFCVGEPDFDTPEPIKAAGMDAIARGDTKYTSAAGTPELRRAVSSALLRDFGLSYEPEEIVITPGGKYAIFAALQALTEPGDEVLLPAPYWTSHYHSIGLAGDVAKVIPCHASTGWKLTPEVLEGAIGENTRGLILNNPNNPSGAVYTKAELLALARIIEERDLLVIADEIYGHLTFTEEPFAPLASLPGMRERTVTMGGVSKAYAMTGWRIGYLASDRALSKGMTAFLSHTTGAPNTMAQAAAAEALLGDQAPVAQMRDTYRARRDCLVKALYQIPGLSFSVPEGAFYLMLSISGLSGAEDGDDVAFSLKLLEEAGVCVVPCADYGAPGHVRLSYTVDEETILEGVHRLRGFILKGRR